MYEIGKMASVDNKDVSIADSSVESEGEVKLVVNNLCIVALSASPVLAQR